MKLNRPLKTLEELAEYGCRPCARKVCTNTDAIHFNISTREFYCLDCMHMIQEAHPDNKNLFKRPLVPCTLCTNGTITFSVSRVGVCCDCTKRVEVPSFADVVKERVIRESQQIYDDLENLFSKYENKPMKWAKVSNLAHCLREAVKKL